MSVQPSLFDAPDSNPAPAPETGVQLARRARIRAHVEVLIESRERAEQERAKLRGELSAGGSDRLAHWHRCFRCSSVFWSLDSEHDHRCCKTGRP